MKHIMIDLETLGTKPGCVVLSIGAVAFDPYAGACGREFYRKLDWRNSTMRIETGTLAWWLDQDPTARAEAFGGSEPYLGCAVTFKQFWEEEDAECLWCHGATFDAPIWEAAVGIVPWSFAQIRDTRTVYDMAEVWPDREVGMHHHALDDARNQAVAVCNAYAKLGLQK